MSSVVDPILRVGFDILAVTTSGTGSYGAENSKLSKTGVAR